MRKTRLSFPLAIEVWSSVLKASASNLFFFFFVKAVRNFSSTEDSSSSAILVAQDVVDGRGFDPVLFSFLLASGKDHFHHKAVLSLMRQRQCQFSWCCVFLVSRIRLGVKV